MSQLSPQDCEVCAQWVPLLDGELDAAKARELNSHATSSPASREFLDKQRAFNAALKSAMKADVPSAMPADVRARLLATMQNEQAGRLTLLPGDMTQSASPQARRAGSLMPLAAAAALLLALLVGAVWMQKSRTDPGNDAPKNTVAKSQGEPRPVVVGNAREMNETIAEQDGPGISSTEYRQMLNQMIGTYHNLVMARGNHERPKLENYAHTIGYSGDIPTYDKMQDGHAAMEPVNVAVGEAGGHKFQAVCFCGGFPGPSDGPSADFTNTLNRVVLFIIDGNVMPRGAKGNCKKSCGVCRATGYTCPRWYDAEKDVTYIAVMRAGMADDAARETIAPISLSR